MPLDEAAVASARRDACARCRIEAVAVCFLHAYANPGARAARRRDAARSAIPELFVTLSHEILREYREYERTSTTALNAFVGPRVQSYLRRLEDRLRDEKFAGKINIMRSNGGVMSIGSAQEQPVSMMESGPVAGMIGAGRLARAAGHRARCIGFDMGGTTAKTSLITDGMPAIEEGYVIGGEASGQPMQLPVVDIVEVGAGGGSIAWCDATGGIHVGPQSAGADPGPGLLRQGLDRSGRDRRQPRARPHQCRALPQRRHEARPRRRPSAPSSARSRAPLRPRACARRRSASCRSPTPRCRSRCARCRSRRASIRATRR